jgi:HEPN domain-containing protein
MKNISLVEDYLKRAGDRLLAVELFISKESWANAVRESQEIVELSLKAYLRHCRIEVPRIHDVSNALLENKNRLAGEVLDKLEKIITISKSLRRDRELAFYGTEDLTPSEFYAREDAEKAYTSANLVFTSVRNSV